VQTTVTIYATITERQLDSIKIAFTGKSLLCHIHGKIKQIIIAQVACQSETLGRVKITRLAMMCCALVVRYN